MARLDDLGFAVAILPASLDFDRLARANDTQHHGVTRCSVLDRLDCRLGRRQWQKGEDLAEVAPQLLAEIADRQLHIARDERVAHGLGSLANVVVIHGPILRLPSGWRHGVNG